MYIENKNLNDFNLEEYELISILSIDKSDKQEEVFDIEVEDKHYFIVRNPNNVIDENIVSHNSATLVLGESNDEEFLNLKLDKEALADRRWNSNNSILATVGMDYSKCVDYTIQNGEPGYFWLENAREYGRMIDKPNGKDRDVEGTNPCCVVGETNVLTNYGWISIKDIFEDLKQYKRIYYVINYSDNTHTFGFSKILNAWQQREESELILVSFLNRNSVHWIKCSLDHKFLTIRGYIEAKDLLPLDELIGFSNGVVNNTCIYKCNQPVPLYDLEIGGNHNYMVDGEIIIKNSEQSLCNFELCCLCETFPSLHNSLEEYLETLKYAYLYAKTVTLLPTHNQRTNAVMMRNRRIGTSQSGITAAIAKFGYREYIRWCNEGYKHLKDLDEEFSNWLCIPRSKKATSVKPAGTTSLLPGVPPGIHFPHSEYYIRRIRVSENSPILKAAQKAGYVTEISVNEPMTWCICIPVKEKNFLKSKNNVSMWEQLELAAQVQAYWADNQVSITVTFRPEEAKDIPQALQYFETRLKSVSFLPLQDHKYVQAPYEEITKELYEEMNINMKELDLTHMSETEEVDQFCDGDTCSLKK